MRFLNLGKKDEYGRQRRIEHRGKYLRTHLQDRMLEVFADFAGLRQELSAEAAVDEAGAESAEASRDKGRVLDINTATFEELQALPHIGPERARAILAMCPLDSLDVLTALDGIGSKRLQAIRGSGVVHGRIGQSDS